MEILIIEYHHNILNNTSRQHKYDHLFTDDLHIALKKLFQF